MTQPNDGGAIVDDAPKSDAEGTDRQHNRFQAQLDEMKTQLETLKKESAGKDHTISRYQFFIVRQKPKHTAILIKMKQSADLVRNSNSKLYMSSSLIL